MGLGLDTDCMLAPKNPKSCYTVLTIVVFIVKELFLQEDIISLTYCTYVSKGSPPYNPKISSAQEPPAFSNPSPFRLLKPFY